VRYCLVRRALAFDQANLMEFKLMEAWNEKLMQSRLEDPSPGFSRTTMKQLELADRKLFCILAEKTREGIKTTVKGRPLDLVFKECTESSEVLSLLQPRPGVAAAEKSKEPRSNSAEPPSKKPKREAGKKGKGKGNNGAFVRIPHDLLKLNCVAATPKNNRICFSYNLKKCDTTGQKCSKGLHVCAVQGVSEGTRPWSVRNRDKSSKAMRPLAKRWNPAHQIFLPRASLMKICMLPPRHNHQVIFQA